MDRFQSVIFNLSVFQSSLAVTMTVIDSNENALQSLHVIESTIKESQASRCSLRWHFTKFSEQSKKCMTILMGIYGLSLGVNLSFYVFRSGISLWAFLKRSKKSLLHRRQKQVLQIRTLTGGVQMKTEISPQSEVGLQTLPKYFYQASS